MEKILKKFWEAGIMHETTLNDNSRYSFEKTLSDNTKALQLLQHDVMRQRELLIGFLDWFAQTNTNGYCDEHIVDWYLQHKDN